MHPFLLMALCCTSVVPVRIAVIGDRTVECDDPAVFPACVEQAVLLYPDVIVTVGDIIEGFSRDPEETAGQWRELLGMLAPAFTAAPVFLVPGNHDIWSDESETAWIEATGVQPERMAEIEGVLFISWDTSREEVLSAEALYGLDSLLAFVDPAEPSVLITHRPFWCMDGMDPGAVARMRGMIERADIEAVLGGHMHIYGSERMGGVLYVSAGTSGGAGLPFSVSGGAFHQTGWLTIDADSASYAVIMKGAILPEDIDTTTEQCLLLLLKARSCGTD